MIKDAWRENFDHDWDEHKRLQRLRGKKPSSLEEKEDRVISYFVYKKTTSKDPRHSNQIKAQTVNKLLQNSTSLDVSTEYARRILDDYVSKGFMDKKEIGEELRDLYYISDNTQYVYEFITVREKGQQFAKRERLAEQMGGSI